MEHIRNGLQVGILIRPRTFLCSVQDAHAESLNLFGVVGLGVVGDVALTESVGGASYPILSKATRRHPSNSR